MLKETLSNRQLQVMGLVGQGYSGAEIGAMLGIEITTVKTHREEAYNHLGVNSSTQALLTLVNRGSLSLHRLVGGYNLHNFDDLTKREHVVAGTSILENGRYSAYKDLASVLVVDYLTVRSQYQDILEKAGVHRKDRVAVLYLAYQQKEMKYLPNSRI